jgi:hypothetical protein
MLFHIIVHIFPGTQSRKKFRCETKFQQNQDEGSSARLVGLGRAQLIRMYQENRKKSSN